MQFLDFLIIIHFILAILGKKYYTSISLFNLKIAITKRYIVYIYIFFEKNL